MPDPIIRPACPNDVEAAIPLIYSSGPDAFNYVFTHPACGTARDFLAHAFPCAGGGFSYPVHWVVELDGEVVGTAAGYTGTEASRFLFPAIRQIFHVYGLAGSVPVIYRGLRTEQVVPPPKGADCFYIANVGIAPPLRGKGLGERLLSHLHDIARERGATFTALDVSVENPRAEALYSRLGYRVTRELPSRLRNKHGYVPNHRRMERSV